ncbi:hypothetical protein Tco_0547823 [Tanacetum coccineum]
MGMCCGMLKGWWLVGKVLEKGGDVVWIVVLCRTKGQPNLGIWYPKDSPFILEAFSDSDYAGASLDRKSTTGGEGCQFDGGFKVNLYGNGKMQLWEVNGVFKCVEFRGATGEGCAGFGLKLVRWGLQLREWIWWHPSAKTPWGAACSDIGGLEHQFFELMAMHQSRPPEFTSSQEVTQLGSGMRMFKAVEILRRKKRVQEMRRTKEVKYHHNPRNCGDPQTNEISQEIRKTKEVKQLTTKKEEI